MKDKKLFHKEIFQKIICALLILLFFIRIINIEADIPQNYLVNYLSIDEGIYGNLALNLQNWGSLMYPLKVSGVGLRHNPQILLNIIGNLIIYIFMFIFGDNYYGFRLGIVFIAFLTLVFIILSVIKLKKNYGIKNYFIKKYFKKLYVHY